MVRYILLILVSGLFLSASCKRGKGVSADIPKGSFPVAFYNLENLFDTIDSPHTNDEDFTPAGKYGWNSERYARKLSQMARVISGMADGKAPALLGLCEVENREVLADLIVQDDLKKAGYGIIHFDSKDERGIDVACLYQTRRFQLLQAEPVEVNLPGGDKTRDLLYVCGIADGKDTLHMVVCHFPSRRSGAEESEEKRVIAAQQVRYVLASKGLKYSGNVIICGDFNDEPGDKSLSATLGANDPKYLSTTDATLFNLMWPLKESGEGSIRFNKKPQMFDQIIVSRDMLSGGGLNAFAGAAIVYHPEWLEQHGEYEGHPLRTFVGNKYFGGFSDHFPVVTWLHHEN